MFITHSLRKGLQRSSTLQRKAELKAAADQGAPCSPVPLQVNTCGCGPLSAPALTGPFLRFRNFIQSTNLWTGSVLIVVQRPTSNFSLHFRQISSSGPESESESVTSVPSLFLSEFQGWKFLRFDLEFPLLSTASEVEYWIVEEEASYGSDLTKSDITSAAPESEPMSTAVPAVILFSESAAANVPSAPATVLAEPDVITGIKTQKQMAARAAPEPAGTGPFEHESELPSMDDRGTASFFFQRYRFAVAAEGAPWHWAFYSCNGFSAETSPEEVADWGGLAPLWKDLEGVHRARPLHVMCGGGDQLYCDDVWQLPGTRAWTQIADRNQRLATPLTLEALRDARAYYFHHYAAHFSAPWLRGPMASVPSIMTMDDHDLWDGFGSYPYDLQTCAAFTELFEIARGFYMLFQQHTTLERAEADGLILGLHLLVQLGPQVAVMLPDQRSARNRYEIIPGNAYAALFNAAHALPDSVDHLVFVSTVPLVYPHILGSHRLAKIAKAMYQAPVSGWLLRKFDIGALIVSDFDEPELLDDLRDHWSAPTHLVERRFLVEHLQVLARSKGIRVSILSGDVHLCGAGLLFSWPKGLIDPKDDFRLMNQIISSAIGNKPPPTGSVRVQQAFARVGLLTKHTRLNMAKLFKQVHSVRTQLLNRRNWCEVTAEPQPDGDLTLRFSLRVEDYRSKWKAPYSARARKARQGLQIQVPTASDSQPAVESRWGRRFGRVFSLGKRVGVASASRQRVEVAPAPEAAEEGMGARIETFDVVSPPLEGKGLTARSKLAYHLFGAYS